MTRDQDTPVYAQIRQFHAENKLRFDELERQRIQYHDEYSEQFKDMRTEIRALTAAFNQARGGWFVLYALGGLVTVIVGIWALVWGIKHP